MITSQLIAMKTAVSYAQRLVNIFSICLILAVPSLQGGSSGGLRLSGAIENGVVLGLPQEFNSGIKLDVLKGDSRVYTIRIYIPPTSGFQSAEILAVQLFEKEWRLVHYASVSGRIGAMNIKSVDPGKSIFILTDPDGGLVDAIQFPGTNLKLATGRE